MIETLDFDVDIYKVKQELQQILELGDQVLLQVVEDHDHFYGARGGNEFEEDEADFNVFASAP